jgi:glutamyl-tRNA synthetase
MIRISRLAPSPTGALHLGNLRTFLVNWALARQSGWRLIMRLEDLDGPRVRAGAARRMLDVLAWIGIEHDGAPIVQSADLDPYRAAMRSLAGRGLVYPCALSRRDIELAARAPHAHEHELRFPPELRPAARPRVFDREDTNYRLVVDDAAITIDDAIAGRTEHRPGAEVGDFVVWTRRGVPAYQLAVVVDDARQHVTDVVRGDDLLPSAARQTLVYRGLEAAGIPRWWHVPLVLGPDGRRLAKRHGDTRVDRYLAAGVPVERVVGLVAYWCGISEERRPLGAAGFRDAFDLARLSRSPITFTEDDEAWLLSAS